MLTVGPPKKKTNTERNKWTKASRDPEKRNPHFSPTMEVKREDEARLQSLPCRLDNAMSLLGIDRKTSSTQNANLLEQLLNCFELVMPSAVNLGPSPATSTSSTPHSVQPLPKSSLELEREHQRPARRQQKRQIYVDAAVDDRFFVCTGKSLKSLVNYLTRNSQCEFCGGTTSCLDCPCPSKAMSAVWNCLVFATIQLFGLVQGYLVILPSMLQMWGK